MVAFYSGMMIRLIDMNCKWLKIFAPLLAVASLVCHADTTNDEPKTTSNLKTTSILQHANTNIQPARSVGGVITKPVSHYESTIAIPTSGRTVIELKEHSLPAETYSLSAIQLETPSPSSMAIMLVAMIFMFQRYNPFTQKPSA